VALRQIRKATDLLERKAATLPELYVQRVLHGLRSGLQLELLRTCRGWSLASMLAGAYASTTTTYRHQCLPLMQDPNGWPGLFHRPEQLRHTANEGGAGQGLVAGLNAPG